MINEDELRERIDIKVDYKEGQTVEEVLKNIEINGETEAYMMDSSIYKATDAGDNICKIWEKGALDDQYILKNNEEYIIGIDKFSLYENGFKIKFNTKGYVFINDKDIMELDTYCLEPYHVDDPDVAANIYFKINSSESATENAGTDTTTETTSAVIDTTGEKKDNNVLIYSLVGVIILLLVVIAALLLKNKNKKENVM